jgi:sialidase-1
MKSNVWKLFLCLLLFCVVSSVQAYTLLGRATVFENGETIGNVAYSCFRIPAIVCTSNGTLVAFAEGRVDDCGDDGNIDIVAAVSYDGGYSWPIKYLIDSDGGNRLHNPCPVYDYDSNIVLIYGRNGSDVLKKTCSDPYADSPGDWSSYSNISSSVTPSDANSIVGTGPSHGIQLLRGAYAGRLLVPYRYTSGSSRKIRLAYSDDGGDTWTKSNRIWGKEPYGINEVCIAELTNGNIYFNMRNQAADEDSEFYRIVCQSSDCLAAGIVLDANTSPSAFDTELRDPVCAGSVLKIRATDLGDNYNHILFANPASEVTRRFMTIKSSFNETGKWSRKKMITSDPSGYSDLVDITYAGREDVGILFETGSSNYHERIDFVLFGESWLREPEVAVYEFEEEAVGSYATSVDTIRNNICFGLNGAVTGSIKYVAGPESDKALEFTSGDYITIDDTYANNTLDFYTNETFYIDAYIKTTSHDSGGAGSSGAIIAKDNSVGTGKQWWLRVENGYAKFLICDGEGHQPSVTSSVKVNTDSSWVHIRAGRNVDEDRLEMYINGNLDNTATDTTTASLKSDSNIRIGNFNNYSRQFIGKISYVRVLFPEDGVDY